MEFVPFSVLARYSSICVIVWIWIPVLACRVHTRSWYKQFPVFNESEWLLNICALSDEQHVAIGSLYVTHQLNWWPDIIVLYIQNENNAKNRDFSANRNYCKHLVKITVQRNKNVFKIVIFYLGHENFLGAWNVSRLIECGASVSIFMDGTVNLGTRTVVAGVFLDVESCSAGERGRFSANAECYCSTGRWQPSAHCQYLHLTTLYSSVLIKTHPATEASASRQDQEFWLRIVTNMPLANGHCDLLSAVTVGEVFWVISLPPRRSIFFLFSSHKKLVCKLCRVAQLFCVHSLHSLAISTSSFGFV